MKDYELLDAIGGVDAAYIKAASVEEKHSITIMWKRILPVAACVCLIALIGVVGSARKNESWIDTDGEAERESFEQEIGSSGIVTKAEKRESMSFIDADVDAAFGYLFPTMIEKGYVLTSDGICIYGESPQVLQAVFENKELNDILLIRIADSSYFGEVLYDTVLYGDTKADGTRASMLYYESDGITAMYQFDKTDISSMDKESSERLYAMIHSAKCFQHDPTNSEHPGNEENDEYDIDVTDAPVNEDTYSEVRTYSADILDLQNRISTAMANHDLPFVTTSAILENPDRLHVTVTTMDENAINLLKSYDTTGELLEIEYVSGSAATE